MLRVLLTLVVLSGCQPEKWGGWEQIPIPGYYVRSLSAAAPGELWVATDEGIVYRGDGTTWQVAGVVGTTGDDLIQVRAVTPAEIWVINGDTIHRWNGTAFVTVPHPLPAPALFDAIWGVRPDDVWVSASSGAVRTVIRWNGNTWRTADGPLIPRWGAAADDAWGIGAGNVLYRWNGAEWNPSAARGVNDVWGLSSRQAWAVGDHRTLMAWDGSSWKTISRAEPVWMDQFGDDVPDFYGVFASGPSDVWAVGGEGPGFGAPGFAAIYHWDGASWTPTLRPGKHEGGVVADDAWNAGVGPALRQLVGMPSGEMFAAGYNKMFHRAPR
jgi:hypothetical protein